MKRMLINATQTEELRVALVEIENQTLLDLIAERQSYKTKLGNVYFGKISSIEPSLDAVFVNYGSDRHGFLPVKEIAREYFANVDGKKQDRNLKELLKEGQHVMVQVEKEERGNKGAALTTFLSLAGSYLVLMPNNPRAGGISRRVEGDDRDDLKEILSNLPLPEGMGLIVRTAGVGKTAPELEWDLNSLLKQWEAIKNAASDRNPPFLIHQESDVVIRTIRDYLRQDVIEILVDDAKLYEKIKNHLEQIRPDFLRALKLYTGNIPLFSRYQIEHQIETAHQREVRLPSGGSIVIDHSEALVAVDVNSARATKGGDIEETALNTNLEAAEEVARQLRLRDIGGLVVIDFIDMLSMRHRREVENHLRNALKLDKARTQIGSISSRFGLLEMSRQRLRHSLGEATQVVCSRCQGWGTIRGVESLALSIIRMIEEDAVKPHTAQIQVQLPIDVATFIINEKREVLHQIEKNRQVEVLIIPNIKLESPHYHIKRLTEEELGTFGKTRASYQILETRETEQPSPKKHPVRQTDEKPAVESMFSSGSPAAKKSGTGIIKRLLSGLFGAAEEEEKATAVSSTEKAAETPESTQRPSHNREHKHGNRGRHNKHGQHKKPRDFAERKTPHIASSQQPSTASASLSSGADAEKPSTQLPHKEKTEAHSGEFKGGRTRRGARGGRRRISGSYKPSGRIPPTLQGIEPPTETLEMPPSHLPPLPTDPSDLENYYKESVGLGKQGRQQAHSAAKSGTLTPSSTPNLPSTPTPPEPEAVPKFSPIQENSAIIPKETDQPLTQENKPVVIRIHPTTTDESSESPGGSEKE